MNPTTMIGAEGKFWLCIAALAAGVFMLVFAHGDVTLQVTGGSTVTAAIAMFGYVIRGESKADHAANVERIDEVAKPKDEAPPSP